MFNLQAIGVQRDSFTQFHVRSVLDIAYDYHSARCQLNADLVRVGKYGYDNSEFNVKYDPTHPAADKDGYILMPNVNPLIELMDMREAQRSFEANLTALQQARGMLQRTLDLLR